MTLTVSKQYELLSLASTTARKIEAEARNVQPNLRRLTLLSNTYDECTSKAAELLHNGGNLVVVKQSPSELNYSTSEDVDEWDPDDSSLEIEEELPEYSLHTSPQVTVSICEYFPEDDDSDDRDSSCSYVIANSDVLDIKNPGSNSTSITRASSNSQIPPRIQSEHPTAPYGSDTVRVAKGPQVETIIERCQPVSSKRMSSNSRLFHSIEAIIA